MKRIILTAAIICLANWTFGQAIDTARFRLNFIPQLSNIQKINPQAVINDTAKETVKFDYYITPVQMDVSFNPSPIKAGKLTPEVGEPIGRNFIKVGFGYPITPLLEFTAHNTNNSKFSFGINLHHFSSAKNSRIMPMPPPATPVPTSSSPASSKSKPFTRLSTTTTSWLTYTATVRMY